MIGKVFQVSKWKPKNKAVEGVGTQKQVSHF